MSKKDSHYVDNEKFFSALKEWKRELREAEDAGDSAPPVSEYIGECFILIAERLSMRANFINYPFRDEMVGDAIENCLMYASNFDPAKSDNPFSYFTQIIYYAFLRRIQKEKKQNFIKAKLLETADIMGEFVNIVDEEEIRGSKNPYADYFKLTSTDIQNFSPPEKKSLKRKKKKRKDGDDECRSLF